MTPNEATKLLRLYTCIDRLSPEQIPDPQITRDALMLVREHSDYQILGICADSLAAGQTALHQYLEALQYQFKPEVPAIDGPIYIKYNPKRRSCHSDQYVGDHRGVLVSCQSDFDDDINELFGHLPLDLFG
jgi:hypothetical protein